MNKQLNDRLPGYHESKSTDPLITEKKTVTLAGSVKKEVQELEKQLHLFIVDWQIHEAAPVE